MSFLSRAQKKDLTAIVLAGGYAKRMGAVCEKTPKSMLKFGNFPFLQYLISWLINNKCKIIISTGHLSHVIRDNFNTTFWKNKGVSIVTESIPLGTAGGIKLAAETATTEFLFICNGDTVVEIDFYTAFGFHMNRGKPVTAILTLNKNVPNQGDIIVNQGMVEKFQEGKNEKDDCCNRNFYRASSTGSYFINRSCIIEYFPTGHISLEHSIMPKLVSMKFVNAYNNKYNFFGDFGTIHKFTWLQNNKDKLQEIYGIPLVK